MECGIQIREKRELETWMGQQEKVILFGEKSLVVILLRQYKKLGLQKRVAGLAYEKTQKESVTFLKLPLKPVIKYQPDSSASIVVLARQQQDVERLCQKLQGWRKEQIICVDYSLLAALSQNDHVNLDFLCVGFVKCGTTSLHMALRKNSSIFLPKKKETKYVKWKNHHLDSPERFRNLYFPEGTEGKKCGCIEPSFYRGAHIVYESFGAETKLIFMLRNPADATYSYFKMMMRRGYDPKHREYFRKYGKYSPEMFQDYLNDFIYTQKDKHFLYDIWLREYLQFYDKERIMIIFFEEIIREPERILQEIQTFIGAKPKKIPKLPKGNEGKQVSRNYFSARVNAKLHERTVENKEKTSPWKRTLFAKIRNSIQKYTLVDNNEKISMADREKLLSFYRPSIEEVERLTGKNLKGLWYD